MLDLIKSIESSVIIIVTDIVVLNLNARFSLCSRCINPKLMSPMFGSQFSCTRCRDYVSMFIRRELWLLIWLWSNHVGVANCGVIGGVRALSAFSANEEEGSYQQEDGKYTAHCTYGTCSSC